MLVRIALIFLLLSIASVTLLEFTGVHFGEVNYWDRHGIFLLFFLATFPRLTLLFSSIPFGGLLWWLGWIFAPRLLVAILATVAYWQTNPFLVVLAWLIAIGGESTEKVVVQKRTTQVYRQRPEDRVIDIQTTE